MPEFDSAKALAGSRPKSLAAFLAEGDEQARLWRPEELAAVFRHQMAAPVLIDLGGFSAANAGQIKALSDAQNLTLNSFAELFRHPLPPLELLQLTKNFAKANMDHPGSAIPGDVASVLYYASIAAALDRLGQRISQLSNADLLRGLQWAWERPWIDAATRTLLTGAMEKLK